MAIHGVTDEQWKKLQQGYKPGASVTAANNQLATHEANDPSKTSKYGNVSEQLLDQYLNRGKFDFNIDHSKLYQQYKDQYTKNANKAMKDTVAQSAAMTGGYANSWGQTAGQQVYQDYMTELDNIIPTIQEQAFNQYVAEGNELLGKYNAAQGQYNSEYDKWYGMLGYLSDKANSAYNKDYGEYSDNLNRELTLADMANADYWQKDSADFRDKEFSYNQSVTERDLAAQAEANRIAAESNVKSNVPQITDDIYDEFVEAYKKSPDGMAKVAEKYELLGYSVEDIIAIMSSVQNAYGEW